MLVTTFRGHNPQTFWKKKLSKKMRNWFRIPLRKVDAGYAIYPIGLREPTALPQARALKLHQPNAPQ